jgi:hypothetical protein
VPRIHEALGSILSTIKTKHKKSTTTVHKIVKWTKMDFSVIKISVPYLEKKSWRFSLFIYETNLN